MFHEGPDRIALAPPLGRPLRQGSFRELEVSDFDRVIEAADARDLSRFTDYLTYVTMGQQIMLQLAYEWCLRWRDFVGPERHAAGLEVYRNSLVSGTELERGLEIHQVLSAGESLPEFGRDPSKSAIARYLPQPGAALESARAGKWEDAREHFRAAFESARWVHDLLFRYSWAAMSQLDQATAEKGLHQVLTSSSFYDVAWQQNGELSPEDLAIVLAEHLRLHFSGPGGKGQVTIVDEPDRIRLVFDPCGSGGSMRRALKDRKGFVTLAQASSLTWGRQDVPTYCAHCAVNELEGLRRTGGLKWITEFHPDPGKPCGWTIFKTDVPQEYRKRLAGQGH